MNLTNPIGKTKLLSLGLNQRLATHAQFFSGFISGYQIWAAKLQLSTKCQQRSAAQCRIVNSNTFLSSRPVLAMRLPIPTPMSFFVCRKLPILWSK